ncbi:MULTISPECIES: phage major capsid protein, P2 family [unclassified Vibrio]|uniref:phage major capsid protein, P2 family n=1 Tax=unclassified Vibrio TaxID=2614977 RepID=UPI0013610820|nr:MULTISPECIES: phage major capsid protein, P2 family [unclassified Vibrio]NAW59487.1 phage major capsid protein, P2 family [Vibrio sp. V36_P2S2PM302]NAX25444.1 phage major capsid protein, P2 family [Vibrio sp. V38_P2S17PM301]NAX30374.1 phage major capsid protein, P2 family [Vibrio sp. V37_P2S8PM304]
MQENTKKKLSAYVQAVAKQNGVDNATEMFNVSPNSTQRIIAAIRESNWFLKRINIVPVKNQTGQAIGLGVTGMIASRTDTSGDGERKPKDYSGMKAMPYHCVQTNFDTAIRYAKLDAWAHMKNFATIISSHTREQIDANKITIGWYGKKAEANTDSKANPNGEDVNKGWFQAMREHNAERLITEGKTPGEIRIGEGGDFINLDSAVLNVKNLLHPACENDANLVAVIGTDLLGYEKAKFYDTHGNTPSEKSKVEERQVIGTYGGLPAVTVPGFPATGIMVTSYDNLSMYIQEDSIRRSVGKKNDAKDQVENFESMNMAYVIEQVEKAAAIEFANVKLWIDGAWV